MRRGRGGRFWWATGAIIAGLGLAGPSFGDPAPGLDTLAVQPAGVQGGTPAIGIVTLAAAAPAGGMMVTLASDNPAAQVPSSVSVRAGAGRATFLVTTTPVAANTMATLSASAGGVTRTARLAIVAPYPRSFSLAPSIVTGGQSVTGTITLSGPAPAGGMAFPLQASPAGIVTLPARATVPAGESQVSFPVQTPAVDANRSVEITAGFPNAPRLLTLAILSPEPAVGPGSVFALPLATHDIVYDRTRRLIYGSLPAAADGTGGIAVVDPSRGVIVTTAPTPAELYGLAISDDGQYLYAQVTQPDNSSAVWRLALPSFRRDATIELPRDPQLTPFLTDFQVLPGHPRSLAVMTSLGSTPGQFFLRIYDDETPRPAAAYLPGQSYEMQFGASADRLYTYGLGDYLQGPEYTGFLLRRMRVSDAGVTVEGLTNNVITGQNTGIRYDSGRLYTSSGRVVDPEAGVLLGRFPGLPDFGDPASDPAYYFNLVEPNVAGGRVYYLMEGGPGWKLRAYDPVSFQLLGEQAIPNVFGEPSGLLRWGPDGLVFRSSENQLFLIRPALGPPTNVLLVDSASVTGGRPATGTVILAGPAPAGGTTVNLSSSDPAAAVPPSVVVAAGESRASFPITTRAVNTPTDVVLTAGIPYVGLTTTHLEVLPEP